MGLRTDGVPRRGVLNFLLRYAAYREYVGNLEQHVSDFALQEGSLGGAFFGSLAFEWVSSRLSECW